MNYYEEYLKELKARHKLPNGLQLVGMSEPAKEQTLEDAVLKKDRRDREGYKLSYASAGYQGKFLKLFYDIRY